MSKPRVFQATELYEGQILLLDEQASHHLARVLRAQKGDALIVFNGRGGEYSGSITAVDKKQVTVTLYTFTPTKKVNGARLCLVQSLARGEKMDWIVQKATELGVGEIFPVTSKFSNVKLTQERAPKRVEHWELVAIHAAEQCERDTVPVIHPVMTLSKWLDRGLYETCFMLMPRISESVPKVQSSSLKPQSIAIIVGPEGGFSEDETKQASLLGVIPLQLGPRVLRTETAGLAALAILQAYFGDMHPF